MSRSPSALHLRPVLILLLASCAALPPAEPRPGPNEVDEARNAQNARFLAGKSWQVHEEAKARHRAAPEDAAALYLYARTIPDREIQRDLFMKSLRLDPSLFHANRGLAVVHLERRDARRAEKYARRALVVRREDRNARLLLARSLAMTNRRKEAEAMLRELLAERPNDGAVAAVLMDFLAAEGREPEALDVFLATAEAGPVPGGLVSRAERLVRGASLSEGEIERIGWTEGLALALHLYAGDGAAALTASVGSGTRAQRIEAALLAGAYDAAGDAWAGGFGPLAALDGEDRRSKPRSDLLAALAGGDHERIARALSSAGFPHAAALAADRALASDPDRADLRELAADLAAWDRFVIEVRDVIRRSYWTFKRKEEAGDFEDVMRSLAALSVRRLGRDIVSGIPVDSYPFVGSVARTDSEGAPEEWSEHGLLFVIGQRPGGPVQGTMMRVVAEYPGREVDCVAYDLIVGEGRFFPTFFEFDGGNIAGFAMPGRVVLDLDQLAGSDARRRAANADGRELWPAADEATRRSLWFPNGIRERLAAGPDDGHATVLDALHHEEGHILDADAYTPFHWHVPSLLYEVIVHGFSVAAMEVTLEKNAEGHALRVSRTKRLALRHTMSFLPWRSGALPHSAAYHDLVADLVEEIDEHPDRYPSIDRRFNILQQMDRLTDAELGRAVEEAIR